MNKLYKDCDHHEELIEIYRTGLFDFKNRVNTNIVMGCPQCGKILEFPVYIKKGDKTYPQVLIN
jgi:hypothetical protein